MVLKVGVFVFWFFGFFYVFALCLVTLEKLNIRISRKGALLSPFLQFKEEMLLSFKFEFACNFSASSATLK